MYHRNKSPTILSSRALHVYNIRQLLSVTHILRLSVMRCTAPNHTTVSFHSVTPALLLKVMASVGEPLTSQFIDIRSKSQKLPVLFNKLQDIISNLGMLGRLQKPVGNGGICNWRCYFLIIFMSLTVLL